MVGRIEDHPAPLGVLAGHFHLKGRVEELERLAVTVIAGIDMTRTSFYLTRSYGPDQTASLHRRAEPTF
jgi:hypothetical protein